MNKRYLFILIPLLALLFFFERGDGYALTSRDSLSPVLPCTSFLSVHKAGSTVNLRTENRGKIKNKIRIKAWDDTAEVSFSSPAVTKILFSYHSERVLTRYYFSFRPAQISANSLRGPPEIV